MDAAKAKADAAKAQAKAKVDEGVQKAKVAAGMAPRDWETGICGCCEDFGGCCMGIWCPCVVSYNVAPEADASSIICCLGSFTIFVAAFPAFLLTGCQLRQSYREKKNIDGGCLDDFLCGGILHSLNLCQMAREIGGGGDSGVARMER